VALSSAGAQRNYVEQVAEALKARGPLLLWRRWADRAGVPV